MIAVGQKLPHDLVGQWLKQNPKCDVVHQVVWKQKGGYELRAGCSITLDARQVVTAHLGARLCGGCQCNALEKEKYKHGKKRSTHR